MNIYDYDEYHDSGDFRCSGCGDPTGPDAACCDQGLIDLQGALERCIPANRVRLAIKLAPRRNPERFLADVCEPVLTGMQIRAVCEALCLQMVYVERR